MWHFAQTWLQEYAAYTHVCEYVLMVLNRFPAYRPAEDKIHLWTESVRLSPTIESHVLTL